MLAISLICVGRTKAGAERQMETRYVERAKTAGRPIGVDVDIREVGESRAARAADRRKDEAGTISALLRQDTRLIALDEQGRSIDSAAFAALIATARDEGASRMAIVVGGPDGLDPTLKAFAAQTLAFGAMTWPHQLVRIMICEQVYRAVTILAGHPYHRA